MFNKRNKTNIKPYGNTVKPHIMTLREIQIIARLAVDSEEVKFGVLYYNPKNISSSRAASIMFEETDGVYIPKQNGEFAMYFGELPKGYYIYATPDCEYNEINPNAWANPDFILKSWYIGECVLLYKLKLEE